MHKVALITGAAKRIGAVITRFLHQQGMNVVIHYRHSRSAAEQLAAALNAERPDSATIVQADLMAETQYTTLIENSVNQWGRLDVLINNASEFFPTPIGQVDQLQWQTLMASNLQAPFFLVQAAVTYLQSAQGCIVNITDVYAERPLKNYSVYSIAKAGLAMLTKSLAKDLAPHIRVNAISPGATLWPEGENKLNKEQQDKLIQRIALKRHGDPSQIAEGVWFCIRNNYLTGQIIAIEGGRLLD